MHNDNVKRTTTSKTPQDTNAMWYKNCLTEKDVISILKKQNPLKNRGLLKILVESEGIEPSSKQAIEELSTRLVFT